MRFYYSIPHWHSRKCYEKEEFHWKNSRPALRVIGILFLGIFFGAVLTYIKLR